MLTAMDDAEFRENVFVRLMALELVVQELACTAPEEVQDGLKRRMDSALASKERIGFAPETIRLLKVRFDNIRGVMDLRNSDKMPKGD